MKKKLLFGAFAALMLCGGIAAVAINEAKSANCTMTVPGSKGSCFGKDSRCTLTSGDVVVECEGSGYAIETVPGGGSL